MEDDRMSVAGTRAMFEAIVSQLKDPELVQVRRRIAVMAACFLLAAAAITIIGRMGWHTMLAFCSTFVPSVIVVWRRFGRRFAAPDPGTPGVTRHPSRPRR